MFVELVLGRLVGCGGGRLSVNCCAVIGGGWMVDAQLIIEWELCVLSLSLSSSRGRRWVVVGWAGCGWPLLFQSQCRCPKGSSSSSLLPGGLHATGGVVGGSALDTSPAACLVRSSSAHCSARSSADCLLCCCQCWSCIVRILVASAVTNGQAQMPWIRLSAACPQRGQAPDCAAPSCCSLHWSQAAPVEMCLMML